MAKDSAAGIEMGRSFHQEGTFNLKVCESDFVPLWDLKKSWRPTAKPGPQSKLAKAVENAHHDFTRTTDWDTPIVFCRDTCLHDANQC